MLNIKSFNIGIQYEIIKKKISNFTYNVVQFVYLLINAI